jgi:hypothetical protein
MKLLVLVPADPGVPVRVLFIWPPDEENLQHQVQAYVFQRRAGGILLVFPDHVIEEEFLRLHAVPSEEGGEPLVGPFQRFRVPIMLSGEDDVLVLSEELGSVVVMDMNLPGAHSVLMSFPEEGEEVDLINHFAYSDSEARPDFVALSAKVREWISLAEGKERLVFYPAAEEEEGRPSPTAKRAARPKASPGTSTQPGKQGGIPKAGPKKHTVASLAQQLETVLAVLPTITDQLTSLTLRQEAMEGGADQQAAPSFQPITTTKTAQPVSALLKGSPTQTLAGLSRQLGPPRVKSVATHPPPATAAARGRGRALLRPFDDGGSARSWPPYDSGHCPAEPGFGTTGSTDAGHWGRPYVRPFLFHSHNGSQGHSGPRIASEGAIPEHRAVLFERMSSYSKA